MSKKDVKVFRLIIAFMFIMPTLCLIGVYVYLNWDENAIVRWKYKRAISKQDYIVHALGGVNGTDCYINSIDILDQAYDEGLRLFEADISFTSDGVLVLAHSGEDNVWSRNDWEQRLGQTYPFGEDADIDELKGLGYDVDKHLVDYDTFMGFRIQGRYKASDLDELLDYMEVHEDMYVMVDAGHRSYDETLIYYSELVRVAADRTDVLNRLIAGGQTTDMMKAVKEVYDFPLLNLYYDSDERREQQIFSTDDFLSYAEKQGVTSYSAAYEVCDESIIGALREGNLISYIFTVNDPSQEEKLRQLGADIIGTDYLWQEGEEQ